MSENKLTFEDYLGEKPSDFFEEIEYSDDKAFTKIEDSIVDQDRWTTTTRYIFKHEPSERFIAVYVTEGSTEYQENDETIHVYEVKPKQVTTTIYKKV